MKKAILLLLVVLLGSGLVFATGGSQQAGTATGGRAVTTNVTPVPLRVTPQIGPADEAPQAATSYTTNPAYPQQPAVSNVNGFPIVQQTTTMRLALPYHSYVTDYYNNDAYRFMQDLTNVRVEWEILPETNTLDRINLMLASGDSLPDAFFGCSLPSTLLITAGAGRLFIPLQDLIEKHTYNLKKLMDFDRAVRPAMISADGNIYSLADRTFNEANQLAMRFWINQKFLDTLGMRTPTTTEEFYQYLVAVKNRDPNGNGRADEIPLVGATEGWHAQIDGFIMNAFIYDETSENTDPLYRRRMFLTDDGKIDVSYNKPAWRQGLEYMRRLNSEGLLATESFTLNKEGRRALVEQGVVGSLPSGGPHEFADPNGERRKDYAILAPLRGPQGVQLSWYDEFLFVREGRFAITKDSRIPEVAIKWADYCYTLDWATRNRYGVLGRDWRIPPAGTIAVNGQPAQFEEVLRWGTPTNVYLPVNNIAWTRYASYNRARSNDPYELEAVLWNAREVYYPFRYQKSVPRNLAFTVEEARTFASLNRSIVEYIEQSMAQFITGRTALNDSTWNAYLQNIDRLGLAQLLQVTQSAFDRSWAQALGYK